jgi:hypothetical protein
MIGWIGKILKKIKRKISRWKRIRALKKKDPYVYK